MIRSRKMAKKVIAEQIQTLETHLQEHHRSQEELTSSNAELARSFVSRLRDLRSQRVGSDGVFYY